MIYRNALLCRRDQRKATVWARVLVPCMLVLGGRISTLASDPLADLPADPRIEAVQSPEAFFGFAIGSRHLRHDQVVAYFRHLAEASDRVTLIPYGHTHGARPLLAAAITSPDKAARLDQLRPPRRRLTSGRLDAVPADAPLVMYMGYSIHGDEASAVNAAPLIAYHLASSQSDEVTRWLAESVFLVDPALNPDGVDRFANWANESRGRFASNQAVAREHNQPWPGGRTNYYWFDLNRDWLPLTHPESQGRLRLFHQWKPNVVLDFHEMGGTSTYFFQPGVPARTNPLSPLRNRELTLQFAHEHAASMDAAGELFFTEEQFDDFYVGKGSTYPDLHGAMGILFEQGSTRGLVLKNELTDRHFRDTVANQVRTSLSSLRAASKLRSELLEFQRSFYAHALRAAQQDTLKAYLLSGSPSRIAAAADLLKRHAIRAYQPGTETLVDGKSYPVGQALVIPLAQPEATFLRSLMEPLLDFEENIFYDVSTWHLPSAFDLHMDRWESDLPAHWTGAVAPGAPEARAAEEPGPHVTAFQRHEEAAGYAFAPTELEAPQLVARLMRSNAEVRVATESLSTRHADQTTAWSIGTYLVLRQPNRQRWHRILDILEQAARRDSIVAQPIDSSMTPAGPDLGSTTMLRLPKCEPLLVVGAGTRAYSAGAVWHFLDIRMAQAATLVDSERLSGVKLDEFSCLILPDGAYGDWGDREVTQLRDYARGGGTVIAISGAITWLAGKGLIQVADESKAASTKEVAGAANTSTPEVATKDTRSAETGNVQFGDAGDRRALESIAGAFLMTTIDPTHPLAYGFPDREVPVFRDHTQRFPLPDNPYQIAARYGGVIAGYVSQRNRERLQDTSAVWAQSAGSGRFIMIADNPVFRGYVRGSERFLTNAILSGPALRIPASPVAATNSAAEDHDHDEHMHH